jgi:hypothetical protein
MLRILRLNVHYSGQAKIQLNYVTESFVGFCSSLDYNEVNLTAKYFCLPLKTHVERVNFQ